MSSSELLLIAIVALLLFGGKRLPTVARQAGKIFYLLRRHLEQLKHEIGWYDIDQNVNQVKSDLGVNKLKDDFNRMRSEIGSVNATVEMDKDPVQPDPDEESEESPKSNPISPKPGSR